MISFFYRLGFSVVLFGRVDDRNDECFFFFISEEKNVFIRSSTNKFVDFMDEFGILLRSLRIQTNKSEGKREIKPRDSIRPSCVSSSIRVSQLSTLVLCEE